MTADELNAIGKAKAERDARMAIDAPLSTWIDESIGIYYLMPRPFLHDPGFAAFYDAVPGITQRRGDARELVNILNDISSAMFLELQAAKP